MSKKMNDDEVKKAMEKLGIRAAGKKKSEKEEIKSKGLREQIDLFKPLLHALISSKAGFVVGIFSLLFFLIIIYLGGILAGIATGIIVPLILIYALSPYVKIETIDPASKGIPTFLGKRSEDYILNEGAVMTVKNVPFLGSIIDYIPIHIGTIDIDLPDIKVRCKDNFEINLHGTMSINADPNRLIEFYNRGGTHGIDPKTGKTAKEREGDRGIVDLLKNIAIVSIQTTGRSLGWEAVYNVDKSLRNKALIAITGTEDSDVNALLLDKTYDIIGIGTQLTNLTVGNPEPLGSLKEVIDMQPKEISEREFRMTDAETARLLYQTVTGITDEELGKVDRKIVEDFYLKVKRVEQMEKEGGNAELGNDIFKISAARFLDNVNVGDILDLFKKLKGE